LKEVILPDDFLEPWHVLTRGRRYSDSELFGLDGLYFRSDIETSPRGLHCPNLSLWGVSGHLEASFIRAEILGFDSIKEGATLLVDSTFGGASLGISV
jgi:hypothetical protein